MMHLYFEKIQTICKNIYNNIQNNIPAVILVYFGVVMVHFVSSNLYPSLCCSWSFWGFIMTPFMSVTPHCEALRWLIHYTGEQIRSVWLWLGGYLVFYFSSNITPYINRFRVNSNKQKTQETQIDNDDEDEDEDEDNGDDGTVRRRSRRSKT